MLRRWDGAIFNNLRKMPCETYLKSNGSKHSKEATTQARQRESKERPVAKVTLPPRNCRKNHENETMAVRKRNHEQTTRKNRKQKTHESEETEGKHTTHESRKEKENARKSHGIPQSGKGPGMPPKLPTTIKCTRQTMR